MKIMDKRELQAFCNELSGIAGDLTALCALTETVKDAVTSQDDPYAASCAESIRLCAALWRALTTRWTVSRRRRRYERID